MTKAPFKKRYAGKHAAQTKILLPDGGTLEYEGQLTRELAEFFMMAMATDGRHSADFKSRLVSMTLEMKGL